MSELTRKPNSTDGERKNKKTNYVSHYTIYMLSQKTIIFVNKKLFKKSVTTTFNVILKCDRDFKRLSW
jgi:hypothetical protein